MTILLVSVMSALGTLMVMGGSTVLVAMFVVSGRACPYKAAQINRGSTPFERGSQRLRESRWWVWLRRRG
jgi:hypothetical protein